MKKLFKTKTKMAIVSSMMVLVMVLTQFTSLLGVSLAADNPKAGDKTPFAISAQGSHWVFNATDGSGRFAFCIEHGAPFSGTHTLTAISAESSSYLQNAYNAWKAILITEGETTSMTKSDYLEQLSLTQLFGAPNRSAQAMIDFIDADDWTEIKAFLAAQGAPTSYATKNDIPVSDGAARIATQYIMWEWTGGSFGAPTSAIRSSWSDTSVAGTWKDGGSTAAEHAYYGILIYCVRAFLEKKPSFVGGAPLVLEYMAKGKTDYLGHTITENGGIYQAKITDTNGAPAKYHMENAPPGMTVTKHPTEPDTYVFIIPATMVTVGVMMATLVRELPKVSDGIGPPLVWVDEQYPATQVLYSGTNAVDERYTFTFQTDQAPEIKLIKYADPVAGTLVHEKDHITYTLEVANTGLVGLMEDYIVRDKIPAYTNLVSGTITAPAGVSWSYDAGDREITWTVHELDPGESKLLSFTVEVQPMPVGSCCTRMIINTAYGDHGVVSNTVEHEQCCPEVSAVKKSDPPHGTIVEVGDIITYYITTYNTGSEPARGVIIKDTIPDGMSLYGTPSDSGVYYTTDPDGEIPGKGIKWVLGDIPAGGQKTVSFKAQVDPLPIGVGYRELLNRAYRNGNMINDTTHFVYGSDIVGVKTATRPSGSIVRAGEQITYKVAIRNNGAGVTSGPIVVKDQIPDGTTLVSVTEDVGTTGAGHSHSATPVAGATSGEITWTFTSIPAGGEVFALFTVTVRALPAGVDYRLIENRASYNDIPTNTTEHYLHGPEIVGVKRSSTTNGTIVKENDYITYYIDVTNTGGDRWEYGTSTSNQGAPIIVTDAVPDNTEFVNASPGGTASAPDANGQVTVRWDIPVLGAGGTEQVWFRVKVLRAPFGVEDREFTNVAYVNGHNTNEITHFVLGGELDGNKTAVPAAGTIVRAGREITYSIKVRNNGGGVTDGDIIVKDQIPDGTEFVSAAFTVPGGATGTTGVVTSKPAVGATSGEVVWTFTHIQPQNEVIAQFTVRVLPLPAGIDYRPIVNNLATYNDVPTNSTTHYQPGSDIAGVKSAEPTGGTTVYEHDDITYTINVTNSGGDRWEYIAGGATNNKTAPIIVTDAVPDNTELDEASITGGSRHSVATDAVTGRKTITWEIDKLDADETTPLRFTVEVLKIQFGVPENEIRNIAYVNGLNTNTIRHTQYPAHLTAIKSAVPVENAIVSDEAPRNIITYTVEVINNGADTEYDIPFFDQIPAGTTYEDGTLAVKNAAGVAIPAGDWTNTSPGDKSAVSLTLKALPKATSLFISFKVKVGTMPTNLDERLIENTARVWDFNTNTIEHRQTNFQISGTKRSSPVPNTNLHEGETITYYIDVVNEGSDWAQDILVSDMIPVGTTFVPGSMDDDGTAAMNVVANNGGAVDAGGEISWTIGILQPNEKVTLTFRVTTNLLTGGRLTWKVTNTAYLDHKYPVGPIEHNVSKDMLFYTKSASPQPGQDVIEGQTITYMVTLRNDGDEVANNVVVYDPIPEGTTLVPLSYNRPRGAVVTVENRVVGGVTRSCVVWTFAVFEIGRTEELRFDVTVNTLAQGVAADKSDWEHTKILRNTAYVKNDNNDDIPTNEVRHTVKKPVITFEKFSRPISGSDVSSQQIITYTIRLTNIGSLADRNLKISDPIPDGTTFVDGSITGDYASAGAYNTNTKSVEWSLTDLVADGQDKYLSFQVKVKPLAYNVATIDIINKAKIKAYDVDNVWTNETVHHVRQGGPLFPIYKEADPVDGSTVRAGEQITYTLTIENPTGEVQEYIPVWDTIPLGTTYVVGSASDGGRLNNLGANDRVEWVIRYIDPGDSYTLTFKVWADHLAEGVYARHIYNVAYVGEAGATTPTRPSNEVSHDIIEPRIVPSKTANPLSGSYVYVGDTIEYTITLHNNTDSTIVNVPVYDTIPAGTHYTANSAVPTPTAINAGLNRLEWVIPSIAARSDYSITFEVTVDNLPVGQSTRQIANRAVSGDGGGPADNPGTPDRWTEWVIHTVVLPPVEGFKYAVPAQGTQVQAGSEVEYFVRVTNLGDTEVKNVPVYDDIPVGTTYKSGSAFIDGTAITGIYDPDGNLVQWTIPSIAAGGEAIVRFTVTVDQLVPPAVTGRIQNVAVVGGSTTNTVVHTVVNPPVYGIKSSNPMSGERVTANQDITYYITIHNDTNQAVTNITVLDVIPDYTTYVTNSARIGTVPGGNYTNVNSERLLTWPNLTIPANGTLVVSFHVTVDTPEAGVKFRQLRNVATVNGLVTNPVLHYIYATPYFGVKTSDPASDPIYGTPVVTGQHIKYYIHVENTDAIDAKNMVVSDKVPAGTQYVSSSADATGGSHDLYTDTVRWVIPLLAAGDSLDLEFEVIVLGMPVGVNQRYIRNTAYINDTPTNTTVHKQSSPVLTAVKSSDPPTGDSYHRARVKQGETITYTVTIRNDSAVRADTVGVIDYIPAGTTYAPGSVSAPGVYIPGGNPTESRVEWTLPALDPGDEVQVTFRVTVDNLPSYLNSRPISNVALVNGLPTNHVDHEIMKPQITAAKTATPPHNSDVIEGQIIHYTIKVKNEGAIYDTDIHVKDLIPDGTTLIPDSIEHRTWLVQWPVIEREIEWVIPTLTNGQEMELSFDVMVDVMSDGASERWIENTGLYGQGGDEPETPTNTVRHNVTRVKLEPTKASAPASRETAVNGESTVVPGSKITYTITIPNNGTRAAKNVSVIDYIPAGTHYVPNSAAFSSRANGFYNASLNRMEYTITEIAAGGSDYVSFQVQVDALPNGETTGIIENHARVNDRYDTNVLTHDVIAPEITAVKSAVPSTPASAPYTVVYPKDTITYTITLTNNSGIAATFVQVTDAIPLGTTYVPSSATVERGDVRYDPADQRLWWIIDEIPVGGTAEVTFTVTVNELAGGVAERLIINSAMYGMGGGTHENPKPAETPTNDVIHTAKRPILLSEKTSIPASGTSVELGDEITYTVRVTNTGAVAVTDVAVQDVLSHDLVYVSSTADGSYSYITHTINWTIPVIAAGDTVPVTFVARVKDTGLSSNVIPNQASVNGHATNETVHYIGTNVDTSPPPSPEGSTPPRTSPTPTPTPLTSPTPNPPSLTIRKSANPRSNDTVRPGDTITYTIVIRNSGGSNVTNAVVTDEIPNNTAYTINSINTTSGYATYDAPTRTITWNAGTLTPGQEMTLTFSVTVNQGVRDGTRIVNDATVRSSVGSDMSNQVIHYVYNPDSPAALEVVKSSVPASGSIVAEGQEILYILTVTNRTRAIITDAELSDVIPAGTTFVEGSGGTRVGPADTFHVGVLAAGASDTFEFRVTVDTLPAAARSSFIENTAQYTYGGDTNSTNTVHHVVYKDAQPPEIHKTSNPESGSVVRPGTRIDYTVTVYNPTDAAMTNLTVTDQVRPGLTYVTGSAALNGSATPGAGPSVNGLLSWTLPTLAARATATITFSATADPLTSGLVWRQVTNQAALAFDGGTILSELVHHVVYDQPNPPGPVTIRKTASPPSGTRVGNNTEITYTLEVSNTGAAAVNNVVVTDDVPSGTTYVRSTGNGGVAGGTHYNGVVTWNLGTVQPGTQTLTFTVNTGSGTTEPIFNTARVTVDGGTPIYSEQTYHPRDVVRYTVEKSASPPSGSTVYEDSYITYSIRVTNTGSTTLYGVQVTDTAPTGTTLVSVAGGTPSGQTANWTISAIAPGSSATVSFVVSVNALGAGVPLLVIMNHATVTAGGTTIDSNYVIHNAVPKPSVPFELVKTSSPLPYTQVTPGQEITYTLTVRNRNASPLTGISVNDDVPAGTTYLRSSASDIYLLEGSIVSWYIPTLAANTSVSRTFTVRVNDNATGNVVNRAVAQDGTNVVWSDILVHYIHVPSNELRIYKTANPQDGTAVNNNTEILYSLRVVNTSGRTLNNVVLTDNVPAGTTYVGGSASDSGTELNGVVTWNLGTLAASGAGSEKTVTFRINTSNGTVPIRNQANATFTGGSSTSNETYHPRNTPGKDLAVTKTSSGNARVGGTITYALRVTNTGTVALSNVKVFDSVPLQTQLVTGSAGTAQITGTGAAGTLLTWTVPTLAPGASADFGFTVTVLSEGMTWSPIVANGWIRNTVTAQAEDLTRSATVNDPLDGNPGTPTKTANPATGTRVQSGQSITYTINIPNGTGAAFTVTVTDPIPQGTTYTASSASHGGQLVNGTLTWTNLMVPAGGVSLTFSVTVNGTANGTIINTAYVNGYATNPVYHSVGQDGPVKTANPASGTSVQPGGTITYTIQIPNAASTPITATVTDTVPQGTTYQPYSASHGGQLVNGVVTWTNLTVPVGGVSLTFSVTVDSGNAQTIINTAYVNGYATNPVYHYRTPGGPTKSANPASGSTVQPGDTITYRIDIPNAGAASATATVTDYLPPGTTYVAGSASHNGQLVNGVLTWTNLTVPTGGVSLTFTVRVENSGLGTTINNAAYVNGYMTNLVTHYIGDPGGAAKSANPASGTQVAAGQSISYTIRIPNRTSAPITVTVTDAIPAGTTYAAASASNGGQLVNGTLTWANLSVPVGGMDLTFRVTVNSGASTGTIINTAYVNGYATNPVYHYTAPGGPTKSANPASGTSVQAGGTIGYTITIPNSTALPTTVTVTDTIPRGTTYTQGSASHNGQLVNGVLTWTNLVVPVGGVTLTFGVTVNAGNAETIINTAYINGYATNPVYHYPGQQGGPTKSANPASGTSVQPGSTITYTIQIPNTAATSVSATVTDQIPYGTTYVTGSASHNGQFVNGVLTWASLTVPVGGMSLTFTVSVNSAANGTVLNNAAYVNGYMTNLVTHYVGQRDEPTKTANPANGSTIQPGQSITYTINIPNGTGAAFTVTVTDPIPQGTTYTASSASYGGQLVNGTLTWTNLTVPVGGVSLTFSVTVDSGNAQTIINTAYVNGYATNLVYHYVGTQTGVTAVKSVSPASGTRVRVGDTLTYTITVRNNGTTTVYSVPVEDTVPSGTTFVYGSNTINGVTGGSYNALTNKVTWSIPSIAPGAAVILSFRSTITVPAGTVGTIIRNQAYYGQGGDTPGTPTNPVENPVGEVSSLYAVKTATPASNTRVGAGDTIRYTVTVTNYGTTAAAQVLVTDVVPDGLTYVEGSGGSYNAGTRTVTWTIPSIAPGASATAAFSATVLPLAAGVTYREFRNTAYINGEPSTPTFHYTDGGGGTGITGVKTADPVTGSRVSAGQTITYSIAVTNRGATAIQNVPVLDPVPQYTTYVVGSANYGGTLTAGGVAWSIALAAGETKVLTFRVTVDALPSGVTFRTIRNSATINGRPQENPDVTHDQTDIGGSLSIAKSTNIGTQQRVTPGQQITYYLAVTNNSGLAAQNAVATDPIPSGTVYVPGSATNGGQLVNGVVTWNLGTLNAYQTVQLEFKVTVLDGTGAIRNVAYINGNPGNTIVINRSGGGTCGCGGNNCSCDGTNGGTCNCGNNTVNCTCGGTSGGSCACNGSSGGNCNCGNNGSGTCNCGGNSGSAACSCGNNCGCNGNGNGSGAGSGNNNNTNNNTNSNDNSSNNSSNNDNSSNNTNNNTNNITVNVNTDGSSTNTNTNTSTSTSNGGSVPKTGEPTANWAILLLIFSGAGIAVLLTPSAARKLKRV